MKTLIATALLAASAAIACPAPTPQPPDDKPQKVCIMVYDAKLKKDVEKCQTIRIRKPFEATPVPQK